MNITDKWGDSSPILNPVMEVTENVTTSERFQFTEDSSFNVNTLMACDGKTKLTVGFSAVFSFKEVPGKLVIYLDDKLLFSQKGEYLQGINAFNLNLEDLYLEDDNNQLKPGKEIIFKLLDENLVDIGINKTFELGTVAPKEISIDDFGFSFNPDHQDEKGKYYYYEDVGFTISSNNANLINSDFYIKITCSSYPQINRTLLRKKGASANFEVSDFLKLPSYESVDTSYEICFEISSTYQKISDGAKYTFSPKIANKLTGFSIDSQKIYVYSTKTITITLPTSSNGLGLESTELQLLLGEEKKVLYPDKDDSVTFDPKSNSISITLEKMATLWEGKNYNKIVTGILQAKAVDVLGAVLTDQIAIDFDFRAAPSFGYSGSVKVYKSKREENEDVEELTKVNQNEEVVIQFDSANDKNNNDIITYLIYLDSYDINSMITTFSPFELLSTQSAGEKTVTIPILGPNKNIRFRIEAIDSTGLRADKPIYSDFIMAYHVSPPRFNVFDMEVKVVKEEIAGELTDNKVLKVSFQMTDTGGSRLGEWNWDYFEDYPNPGFGYSATFYIDTTAEFLNPITTTVHPYLKNYNLQKVQSLEFDLNENILGQRLYIKCVFSNGYKASEKIFIYSGAVPTVSYRRNAIGINTPEIGTETDAVVAISSTEGKNKILINNLDAETTFQIRAQGDGKVALVGFLIDLIDCGTWDNSTSTE